MIVDWYSRRVPISFDADSCIEALEEAVARYGKPDILDTDRVSQFRGTAFTGVLIRKDIAISMDGKGCWRDDVFVERLWRSVKYEEVYLHAYPSVPAARAGIGGLPGVLQCREAAFRTWRADLRPDILRPAASRSGMITNGDPLSQPARLFK